MKNVKDYQFAVLGLGRFGMSILETLAEYDVSVLACDNDHRKVQAATAFATQALQLDIADEASLDEIGIGNFDVVIVAVGEDLEAMLMATSIAKEKGAGFVLAKAATRRQSTILKSIGADRVVLPEREMGQKVARGLLNTNMWDIFEDTEHYVLSEIPPQESWVGKSVAQSHIRKEHGITILAIRRGHQIVLPISPDEVLQSGDVLIILSERNPT